MIIKSSFNKIRRFIRKNYDYTFLNNRLRKIKRDTKVLVTGISYSAFGIEEKILKEKTINLSLPSQDIYYAFKIASKAIPNMKNIRYCIIGTCYYGFHFDLSKSVNQRHRIEQVYYPILKDSHNYDFKCENNKSKENIIAKLFNKYFNILQTRKIVSGTSYNPKKLPEDKKEKIANERATYHNKLIKYEDTSKENMEILRAYIDYLNLNNIKPIIIIFPASEYYRKYFNSKFKEEFYKKINYLNKEYKFEIIDLFESNLFKLEDYVDFDHLNKNGAIKVTNIINKYIFSNTGERYER